MKTCSKCGVPKDFLLFCKNKTSKDGLQSNCKKCASDGKRKLRLDNLEHFRALARERYRKNPTPVKERSKRWADQNPLKVKARHLKKLYGITLEEFDRLMALQGGVCAICRTVGGKMGLAVDHDHLTGNVRGILCSRCNTALGLLLDSKELLEAAHKYIETPTSYEPIVLQAV